MERARKLKDNGTGAAEEMMGDAYGWLSHIVHNRLNNIKMKGINYNELSSNPNITWDIITDNPDKEWDYGFVSLNSNITWEIVNANPDKPWKYDQLSANKMSKDPFFTRGLNYVLKGGKRIKCGTSKRQLRKSKKHLRKSKKRLRKSKKRTRK
jgi:hypothetical protein